MTVGFQAFCLLLFKAIDMFYDIFRVFFFLLNMIGNELFFFSGTLYHDFPEVIGIWVRQATCHLLFF